jgi:ABC-type antimicrobial peptide transport system permease subunit
VVKDFHFGSLYKKVTPFFLRDAPNNSNTFVRIKVGTEKQTLGHLEQLYKQYNQGLSFEYRFLDDDYQLLYSSEQKVAMLSRYFAGMAILISCLGLFGLTAFTAQKRQKEIAIRKTIGASVSKIVGMLAREFLTLVVVALLIALPVAWWLANAWLLRFAYRVRIGPAIFLLAAAAILLLTALTVSYQAVKAAVANPVKSLRTE